MKKIVIILVMLFFTAISANAAGTIATYVIDPEKNAYHHNNLGVMYIEEKDYYAAIQEFKMAISLNPKTQATATYFNNLGRVYMIIGYPEMALDCFQNALKQYPLNFEYYKNLVDCYDKLGKTSSKLSEYKAKKKSSLDKITLALLYEKSGDIKKAIFILDEFANAEPDLLISQAVKMYIQELVNSMEEDEDSSL